MNQTSECPREASGSGGQVCPLICTVVPVLNERDNVAPLIRELLARSSHDHAVVLVDDNSSDGTASVARDLASSWPPLIRGGAPVAAITLIERSNARGLTSALQCGIDHALNELGADVVTWMDSDLSMPPAQVENLVGMILRDEADVAVGSRWMAGGGDQGHALGPRALSWGLNRFARCMLGGIVHDYTSGFVAARGAVLEAVRLRGEYGEYCIDFLHRAARAGFRVREWPYICTPRTRGESKTGIGMWDYLWKGRRYVAAVCRAACGDLAAGRPGGRAMRTQPPGSPP